MPKFNPPESFNFSKPGEWPEWKQRFTRFRTATKLNGESDEVQISSLVYAMGAEAETVIKSFVYAEEGDDKKYPKVLKLFDDYFVPKKNVIHERARFHLRSQNQGESVESFVRSLHEIAAYSEFGQKSEQIRDRLVIGINDKELSERLQLLPDLTLEKAVEMARNSELVKSQIKDLQSKNLDSVQQKQSKPKHATSRGRGGYRGNSGRTSHSCTQKVLCDRCNQRHEENDCPARGRKCRKCHRLNHFAVCCRTPQKDEGQVHEVTHDSDDSDSFFLGSIQSCDDASEAWTVELTVCDKPVTFKIDTGADTSVITESTYNALPWKPKLDPVRSPLISPGGPLKCIGMFHAKTYYKSVEYRFRVHVVQGSHSNLISRSVANTMGLVVKVDDVRKDVFGKYGRVNGPPVKITLRDDAKPYCVTTARRIPFPIMPKVEAELQRMENAGIIVKVTEPRLVCADCSCNQKERGCAYLRRFEKVKYRRKA